MDTYYSLLGISEHATAEEVAEAYRRQRERYNAERVAVLGSDFQHLAAERSAALDRAFTVLSDPQRRRAYDRSIGAGATGAQGRTVHRTTLSRRELGMAIGGGLAGLVIIAIVWALAGRAAQPAGPAVAAVPLRPAPDFTLADLNGKPVSLSDYRGKVVMLNFWYTNCAPCKEETPALQRAYQRLADRGLVIVGVNVRQQERGGEAGDADVRNFAATYGVTYPVVFDRAGATGRDYQVYVLPTSVFIDQNGTERFRSFSAITAEDVERVFMDLQREAAALR